MLSNIGMTSGVSGLRFVYCFIVLFKKAILSPLDLVLTVSITGCDPVSRAMELDVWHPGKNNPELASIQSCSE